MRQKTGRIIIAAGALVLFLLIAILALPVWFPWGLKLFASRVGLHYSNYQRRGYGEFLLQDVVVTNASIRFEAARVQALVPSVWLWRLEFAGERAEPFLVARNWQLAVTGNKPVSAAGPTQATHPDKSRASIPSPGRLTRQVDEFAKWLPAATLTNGTVDLEKTRLSVPLLHWSRRQLSGEIIDEQSPQFAANFRLSTQHLPYVLEVVSKPLDTKMTLNVSTNSGGYEITGITRWSTNDIYLQAQMQGGGLIPKEARIAATNLMIPAAYLKIPRYGVITCNVNGVWNSGRFDAQVRGAAPPLEPGLPSVTLDFHVRGSTNEVVIREAQIDAPGLQAKLSKDLAVLMKPPWLAEPAQVSVSADLGELRLLPLTGKARANVFLAPSGGAVPSMRFFLTGSDIRHKDLLLSGMEMNGNLKWPELAVDRLRAELWPGTFVTFQGACDLSNRVISLATFEASSSRPPLLPEKIKWNTLSITGTVSGPFDVLAHNGSLQARSVTIGSVPVDLLGLTWKGEGTKIGMVELKAASRGSAVEVGGALSLGTNLVEATLERLAFLKEDQAQLELEQPVQLRFAPSQGSGNWSVRVGRVKLSGPGGALGLDGHVDWPEEGALTLESSGLETSLLKDFADLPPGGLDSLKLTGSWSNGPVSLQLATALHGVYSNVLFNVKASATSDSRGTRVKQLALAVTNEPVLKGRGHLPISFWPGATNVVVIDPSGSLQAEATVERKGLLWGELTRMTGWQVEKPELSAGISGTWAAPEGNLQFRAQGLGPTCTNLVIPKLGPISLAAEARTDRLSIRKLDLEVQEQPVSLSADVPVNFTKLASLKRLSGWTNASVSLRVPRASIASFESLAPTIVAPEGEIMADVSVKPGLRLGGELVITNARTASIGTLGPVRDVRLRLVFDDKMAMLESGSARIGGVPVSLAGQARIVETNLAGIPLFRITVRGTEVPISRQSDVIVRGDLDLAIVKTNQAAPLIAGKVRMGDSYYLSDLAALVPGKVVNPRQRPPYFSVDDKVLKDWKLDLSVTGERGLRIRTPVAVGQVSPNMRLTGTLNEPIAVGNVSIDSGTVRFPFGAMEIQQGLVTATTQDPFHPQIILTAASRQYGYDLRLQVSGTVDSPVLQFTSTPPLGSDQILLMLTAGELPKGGITLTPQQRAQTFAMFLGRDLLSKLGFGDDSAARLTLRSGEDFSEEGKPTYDLEYKLTDRWSVTGEYDRFGDFNAGFKWRVYSK